MSRTDAHRPAWVQCNDDRGSVEPTHGWRCRSGSVPCDLPSWPVPEEQAHSRCHYAPIGKLRKQMYGYAYATFRGRKHNRKTWYAADRRDRATKLRIMVRQANSGIEPDDSILVNLDPSPNALRGGGYWD